MPSWRSSQFLGSDFIKSQYANMLASVLCSDILGSFSLRRAAPEMGTTPPLLLPGGAWISEAMGVLQYAGGLMLVLPIAGSGWCLFTVAMGVLEWADGLMLLLPVEMEGSLKYLLSEYSLDAQDGVGLMLGVRLEIGGSAR